MPDRMMTVHDLVPILWNLMIFGIGMLVGYFLGIHQKIKKDEQKRRSEKH